MILIKKRKERRVRKCIERAKYEIYDKERSHHRDLGYSRVSTLLRFVKLNYLNFVGACENQLMKVKNEM